MIIHLATDHAGFEMKEFLKEALEKLDYEIVDHGNFEYAQRDDFNDYIKLAAEEVSIDPNNNKAIIIGGSGQGEAMVANRFANVRAVVYYHFDPEIIKVSREHNDANILSIGARFLSDEEVLESVLFWLEIPFSGKERYLRRIEKTETDTYTPED